MKKVCVIGLGYVGLPLADLCARRGYEVYGYDVDSNKIELVNQGINPFEDRKLVKGVHATTDDSVIADSDVVVVCVPTPVDSKFNPNLDPVKSAINSIKNNLKIGSLILVESTINPGVCEEVIKPMLDEKYKDGSDYYLAHCPERINPGDSKWNVENISRVLGSTTPKGLDLAHSFYKSILRSNVTKMSSIKIAEAVKVVENSFRDINIAFVNELAKSFDALGIDLVEVIKGAATKPFAFMPHYPSCGVGGHCIPVDPYYLIERAKENGFTHELLRMAREINNSMPNYTVELAVNELNKLGLALKNTKVGVLGVAYKRGVGDMRESPALKVIELLKNKGADLKIYDPYVKELTNCSLNEVLNCDCIVLLTDHLQFLNLDYSNVKLVIDGKNFLDKTKIQNYKGIGR